MEADVQRRINKSYAHQTSYKKYSVNFEKKIVKMKTLLLGVSQS